MADQKQWKGSPWRDEETLRRLYVDQTLEVEEIGDRLGCSRKTVEKWKDRFGLKRPWCDPERLRYLRDQGLSQKETGERLGCSQTTIYVKMREFDIDPRGREPKPWHDESTLRGLYWEEGLDMNEIADHFGCDRQAIENWMKRHDIQSRSVILSAPDELADEEWLREQYVEQHRSTCDIATELGCAPSTVFAYIEQYGIETRPVGMYPGEHNHQWKGGVSRSYGPTWKGQRREARERDDYTCQRCGMGKEEHEELFDELPHVHHITPFRQFDDPEEAHFLENLITLCRLCHRKVEGLPIDTR